MKLAKPLPCFLGAAGRTLSILSSKACARAGCAAVALFLDDAPLCRARASAFETSGPQRGAKIQLHAATCRCKMVTLKPRAPWAMRGWLLIHAVACEKRGMYKDRCVARHCKAHANEPVYPDCRLDGHDLPAPVEDFVGRGAFVQPKKASKR